MTAATLVRSPEVVDIGDRPVIFLAGPIQGSEDWQSNAAWMISDRWKGPEILIANPRRAGEFPKEAFTQQADWELNHLDRALTKGLVLFWLGRQNAPMDLNRTYAQTSRFELGYVVGQLTRSLNWGLAGYCPLALGVDPRLHGVSYIQHVVNREFKGKVVVQRTLSATVDSALSALSMMLSEP